VTAAPSSHARRRFFLPAFICSSPFLDGYKGGGALLPGDRSTGREATTGGNSGGGGGGEGSKIVTGQVRLRPLGEQPAFPGDVDANWAWGLFTRKAQYTNGPKQLTT
jgi:hypothetical protein